MTDKTEKCNGKMTATNSRLPQRSWKQRLFAVALIAGLLLAGILAARWIVHSRPRVRRKPPGEMVTLVEAVTVKPGSATADIRAQGRVVPAREIVLKARVTGRVVYLNPRLVPGGIITRGEVLLRLDDTDYRLNFRRLQDALALEEADLRIEQGNQAVARQEWELIRKLGDNLAGGIDESSRDLALRQPQLAKIKARIQSARTALERARVDLERTVIKAPFDLVVRAEDIDIGSEITPATRIATLAATDVFWAELSVPVSRLGWFDLPGDGRKPSPVEICAGDKNCRFGQILSLAPDLDKNGLMARILVAVEDPLGRRHKCQPLLLGSFVQARITGRKLENVFRVPRSALQENQTLLLVDAENRLQYQPVHIVWKNFTDLFIDRGLAPGDRVVTSTLPAPVAGMLLKVVAPPDAGDGNHQPAQGGAGSGREVVGGSRR